MSDTVFVLLGAGHTRRCWDLLVAQLKKAGYPSLALSLTSSGSTPPTTDSSLDTDVIRSAVTYLAQEVNVVVVAHTFGGMAGATALEGLDKQSCYSRGWKGGVVRLVYIAALLVPDMRHDDLEQGIITIRPEDVKDLCYQDLSDEAVAEERVEDLQPQSLDSFWSKSTYAAWRHIPTTFILCTRDEPSAVMGARNLVDAARAGGQHKIDSVIEHNVDDSPLLSQPEWLAETLVKEARRLV